MATITVCIPMVCLRDHGNVCNVFNVTKSDSEEKLTN